MKCYSSLLNWLILVNTVMSLQILQKMGISRPVEWTIASQEGLCSIELLS